jgi:acylphosphatase
MTDPVRQHVVVRGHVQGVFFRDSMRREAQRRGVSGWVRNRPDGAVEAVFEGPPSEVDALVEFCSRGPRGAHVHDVDVRPEAVEGLSRFEVLPS